MSFRDKLENRRGTFTVIVLVAVGALLLFGWFGTDIKAEEDKLKITGLHGQKISYMEIVSVELIDQLPTITARTGGYSLGGKKLGNFSTEEYGAVKLYLQNGGKPFIFITGTEGKLYFMNLADPGDTSALYSEIIEKIN